MNDAFKRPALYYPYVHIRSEHWLKATLLCVPAVKRMVPDTYTPEDSPNIIEYTKIEGLSGPLLQAVSAFSPAADAAQQSLLAKLKEREGDVLARYHRSQMPGEDDYWIHDAKFNGSLLQYLVANGLAWQSSDPGAYGHRTWYALHPLLGSAIMTTLGLSIALEDNYDIVTPSTEFHEALLTTEVDAIFDMLLTTKGPRLKQTTSQASRDLGQLVITLSGVNFRALQPQAIPELQSSPHFGIFQNLIKTKAKTFELNGDPGDYKTQLTLEANEIITAWHEAKQDLGNELKNVLFDTSMVLGGAALKSMIKGGDVTDLAVEGGVAVALLTRKGLQLSKKRKHGRPTQYLTEVVEKQSEALQMTFPLGLEQ
jgi:hypothetical protein